MTEIKEHIGPSLWHGREVNVCTRCKYLRCQLVRSGREPDYEYFCMHPNVLSGEHIAHHDAAFLEKVKDRFPDKLAHFQQRVAEQKADVAENGEFISNDSYTPETPHWCPVLTVEKAESP